MDKIGNKKVLNLKKVGLSKCEANVYLALNIDAAFSMDAISKKTGIELHTLYRVMKQLKNKGFVEDMGGYPKKYQIYPLENALNNVLLEKKKRIKEVKNVFLHKQHESRVNISQTHINVVVGKKKIFTKSTDLIKESKSEVFIISIGEEIPEELLLQMRNALQRNVDIRIIAHRYDEENKNILLAWKKMGIKIRHKRNWGFHLLVYDGTRSLLITNNPDDTRERTGIVIFSKALSFALREYFMKSWHDASEIDI